MRSLVALVVLGSLAASGCAVKRRLFNRGETKVTEPAVIPVVAENNEVDDPQVIKTVTLAPFRKMATDSAATIDAALKEFDSHNLFFEVEGHTDSTGSEAVNQRVGLERANAVRDYLLKRHGVPGERIDVVSYGEARPAVGNDTPEHRAQNRRVVVNILQ